jgi:flagellar biosynthesis/type III secretory pathway M-ring protein FliF/YscJ
VNGVGVYALVFLTIVALVVALVRASRGKGAAQAETKAQERQNDALRADQGEANEIERKADLARRGGVSAIDVLRRAGRLGKRPGAD